MIRRHSLQLGCELGASMCLELVGVELDAKSRCAGCGENRQGLLHREHAGLAEHVSKARQTFARDDRKHLLDEMMNVVSPSGGRRTVLERNLMRAEPRGHQPNGKLTCETSDNAK